MADAESEKPEAKRAGRSAAGTLAAQIARLYAKTLHESLAPLGVAPAQFLVLRELWRTDGQTQRELAQVLEVEQATMSNTLKRMIRDGYVRYAPHPDDSRARRVFLQDRGMLLERPAKAVEKDVRGRAFAGLTRKEQKRFVDLSLKVITALKGEAAAASGAS